MRRRTSSGMAARQAVMAVVAIVLAAAAALLIWRQIAGSSPPKTLTLCCEHCGKVLWSQPPGGLPRECPGCHKIALRRAVQCGKCGHICAESKLVHTESASPMEPALPKCPKCGSPDINEPRREAEPAR